MISNGFITMQIVDLRCEMRIIKIKRKRQRNNKIHEYILYLDGAENRWEWQIISNPSQIVISIKFKLVAKEMQITFEFSLNRK